MSDDEKPFSANVLVFEPDTTEEEARSSTFAALLKQARELKEGDDTGIQNLMYVKSLPSATPFRVQYRPLGA